MGKEQIKEKGGIEKEILKCKQKKGGNRNGVITP